MFGRLLSKKKMLKKIVLPGDYQEGHSSLINYQEKRDETNSVLVSCAGHVTAVARTNCALTCCEKKFNLGRRELFKFEWKLKNR